MKSFICIGCPVGCQLSVETLNDEIKVYGNDCNVGKNYAIREISNPVRVFTTSVKSKDGRLISVKSKEEIPKSKIMECAKELKNITVEIPIKIGDVVLKNVADTGIDIVATREVL
ncbi:MAG: DUF1667 domain-containing protein [Oscillospiraceae bacterium]|nr:DUF1667 domain-containing protein [Oscillospiraceae bacterium]